jgi:transglutaminase-like putative cysteine protease
MIFPWIAISPFHEGSIMRACGVRSFAVVAVFAFGCLFASGQTAAEIKQAQQHYSQATSLETKKDVAAALEAIQKAVELVPDNDVYLALLAKLEFQQGNFADAIAHGQKAIELKPDNAKNFAVVMRGAFAAKEYEIAKDAARKILLLGAKSTGLASEAQGMLTKAEIAGSERLHAAALASPTTDNLASAIAAVTAASRMEPKNKVHRERLAELEALTSETKLEAHALKAPADAEKTLDGLAEYLVKPAKSDRVKARLIYRWVTDRISYDADSFFKNQFGDNSAEGVLSSRKGVCEGYSQLFNALAQRAGLQTERVTGIAKGIETADAIGAQGHAWNAVKLDGQWRLIDATWGAGYVSGKKYVKSYDDYYLFVTPERLIFTHLPEDSKWQLLDPAVSREEFESGPFANRNFFKAFAAATPTQLRLEIGRKDFKGFPKFFDAETPYKIIDAPFSGVLAAGKAYRFEFDAPNFGAMTIQVEGKLVPLLHRGTRFETRLALPRGTVVFMGKRADDASGKYSGLVEYKVQ